MAKRVLKTLLRGAFLTAALPLAAAAGFGRWASPYTVFAHLCALAPGTLGDYLRIAFYRLTLTECSLSSRISFGSFFAHSEAKLGPNVYIGSYCVIRRIRWPSPNLQARGLPVGGQSTRRGCPNRRLEAASSPRTSGDRAAYR